MDADGSCCSRTFILTKLKSITQMHPFFVDASIM